MTLRAPLRRLAVLGLAVFAALAQPGSRASAGTAEIECYHESLDADGDGYASVTNSPEDQAKVVMQDVDEDKKLYCEGPYVAKKGDCYPTRWEAHPHAPEIPFNGKDEDCNAGADEPELVYFPNGNQNTKTSFSIRVRLGSQALVGLGSSLAYDVQYADLAASTTYDYTVKRSLSGLPMDYTFDAWVGGLDPGRVYRAKVRFYQASAPPPPTSLLLGARPARVTPTYTYKGESEWYYTTTQGDGSLEAKRTEILLEGFYQRSESDHGYVGYKGTVKRDGTRYGAAAKERWCSEFYTWLTGPHFWLLGAYTTVPGVISWFAGQYSWYPGHASIPAYAKRGDYIPVDTHETDGDSTPNHSTMFLAYELTTNEVWTLEGNAGIGNERNNYVHVRERDLNSFLKGVGHLR